MPVPEEPLAPSEKANSYNYNFKQDDQGQRVKALGVKNWWKSGCAFIFLALSSAPRFFQHSSLPVSYDPANPAVLYKTPRIALSFTDSNYDYFQAIAEQGDRLIFFRHLLGDPDVWPQKAVMVTEGDVALSWPSWRLARQYETLWAPYVDVFAYDVEYDSPLDEIDDVPGTISELRAYLDDLEVAYGHSLQLSCGLNYQFGTNHSFDLARCEDVHIHANQLLRIFPERDKKGQDYVDWAVARAVEVRYINPDVGIWFSAFVPGADPGYSFVVVEAICRAMKERNMLFEGFTFWGETGDIEPIIEQIKHRVLCLVRKARRIPR